MKFIDATPIGINIRSTVATYAGVHDELRKIYAKTSDAKRLGKKAGDFSYNTGSLRCPTCDGTGSISLDIQFLPDVEIVCPDCGGSRYCKEASLIRRSGENEKAYSLVELMKMSVNEALTACDDLKTVKLRRVETDVPEEFVFWHIEALFVSLYDSIASPKKYHTAPKNKSIRCEAVFLEQIFAETRQKGE